MASGASTHPSETAADIGRFWEMCDSVPDLVFCLSGVREP
jgi:hypothetical protein